MDRRILRFGMALAALTVCCISSPSYARVGVGVYVGPGYYYGPPAVPYYYPPVVAVPVAPPVYVENDQASGAPGQAGSWYYCDASKTYYPYVKQCAAGWREVPAQPAPSN